MLVGDDDTDQRGGTGGRQHSGAGQSTNARCSPFSGLWSVVVIGVRHRRRSLLLISTFPLNKEVPARFNRKALCGLAVKAARHPSIGAGETDGWPCGVGYIGLADTALSPTIRGRPYDKVKATEVDRQRPSTLKWVFDHGTSTSLWAART